MHVEPHELKYAGALRGGGTGQKAGTGSYVASRSARFMFMHTLKHHHAFVGLLTFVQAENAFFFDD
eukprot:23894-Eustigmatos_ZCMA.PRE.1